MENTEPRQQWGRQLEFLLALIGFSVSFSNIWRFPYTCYDSGGGAFLVAYLIMWLSCGIPLLYMELAVGQLTSRGPIGALSKLCPIFKGVGVGAVIKIAINRTLYVILLVWSFYYLFNSFKEVLPWSHCGNYWNSLHCVDSTNTLHDSNYTYDAFKNTSSMIQPTFVNSSTSPAVEYFRNHVLQLSGGISNLGYVRWEFALILLFAWILMYFAIFKGTKSIGKVVYVTALFPYILLTVFIIKGLSLPGSYEGMVFFFKPKWSRLKDPKVWASAAATNFFSLGIGGGVPITLASFNRHEGNIFRYTAIVATVDLLSSVMSSVAVFSTLGYLAQHQERNIDEVVNSGTELAFIVFPEIFNTMPLSQLFSVLFFLMLITLAIDSLLVGPKVIITAITDNFKHLPRQEFLYAFVCLPLYFLAFPTITQGGIYYFALMDYHITFGTAVSLAFFEVVAIAWIYGAKKLAKEISETTGSEPHFTIVFCWQFICPLIIMAIWVFSIVRYKPFTMGKYVYPVWAVSVAWIIAITPLICLPICMVESVYRAPGNRIFEKLRFSIRPKMEQNINLKSEYDEPLKYEHTASV